MQASVLIGQRQQQVDLSFTEPYFLGKEIAAGGDLFFVQTDRQSESSFDTTTIGGDLRANYPLTEHLRQGWTYTLKQTDVNNVPNDASVFIKEAEGTESLLRSFAQPDLRSQRQPHQPAREATTPS